MAELLSLATALPRYRMSAADTKEQVAAALPEGLAARVARMVDATGNDTRYGVLPLPELRQLETLEVRNQLYLVHARELGEQVASAAIRDAGLEPGDINAIIGISSTGYLMPTLETHLLDCLGLPPSCRRVPLTQLGCAGGAAGLALAAELSIAAPSHVLVVSVELPSLSFPTVDPSATDLLAALQFGDGAAATVVSTGSAALGPEIVASRSIVFPNTIDRDGVRLTTGGLRLMRPRGLAEILRRELAGEVDILLDEVGIDRESVDFWIAHPRNPDLIDAVGASLALPDELLIASRNVWRHTGNQISSAVFHVLDELRNVAAPSPGQFGMMIAFGAGFSCELLLLRADGWLCAPRIDRFLQSCAELCASPDSV